MQNVTLPLLGVVFVALKLTHFIDWSWWWVTLPFWGGAALFIILFAIFFVAAAISDPATIKITRNRRNRP